MTTTNWVRTASEVKVGMGATLYSRYTADAEAYTVIAVNYGGNSITLQRDKAILVEHKGWNQTYRYERDTEGRIIKASFDSGLWRENKSDWSVLVGLRLEKHSCEYK